MMRLPALVFACALLHAAPALADKPPVCAAPQGTAALLARPERFLIFGEMHGTAEGPRLFAEIACEAAKTGPLAVGIEFSDKLQPALDAFMSSDGSPAATAAFREAFLPHDHGDGRGSIAMLMMIERLQQLKQAGAPIRVSAFIETRAYSADDPIEETQTPYEKRLARGVIAAAGEQRVIVLVGNIHAMRAPFDDFEPMAMHLPAATLTFNLASSGGEAWNCLSECGPHPMRAAVDGPPRVSLLGTPRDGFDGEWHIGRSTAARPARQVLAQANP